MKPKHLLSILTRSIFLLAVFLSIAFPVSSLVSDWLLRTDPFLAVDSLLSHQSLFPVVTSLAVLLATCFFRRFFCQWLCPFGAMLDISRMGAVLLKKCHFPVANLSKSYKILGRLLLLLLIIAPFAGGMSLFLFDPTVFTFVLADYRHSSTLLILLVTVPIIGTLFIPNLWCGILCPCGALSDVVYHMTQTLLRVTGIKKKKVKKVEENPRHSPKRQSTRRVFLGKGILAMVGVTTVGGITLILRKTIQFTLAPIRPAGSAAEPKFSLLCTRCGKCQKICPTKVLVPLAEKNRSFQTPVLDFETSYCRHDCHRCGDACPTGAILPLSVEEKQKQPTFEIRVHFEGCRLWNNLECTVCQDECPLHAITFVWNEEKHKNVPQIDKNLCAGCGRCVHFCPGNEGEKGLTPISVSDIKHSS